MTTTTAYLADPAIKDGILTHLRAHREADQIVHGTYWERGKGCAVGCSLESWKRVRGLKRIQHGSHALYDDIFGPGGEMLARLEDRIFEGLANGSARDFPIRFAEAIRPGADLSRVGWQFLHWLLTDKAVNPGIDHPLVRDAIRQCADVLVPLSAERSAASAAASAAVSAERAASAAWSAASAAASAAWSAAWSAERSAERRAESAERAASAARSAASAARSAAGAAYVLMADKLVELLGAA